MKKFGIGLVLMASVLTFAAGEGVVTADILNARRSPSVKAPVMFRFKKGDAVKIISEEENNWMALSLPENAPVYVSEAYVVGGKALRNIKMFAGKGSKFPIWGELGKGDAVKLVDDRGYGWVRIVPPEGLKVYVCSLYVDVKTKPEAKKPEAAKPEAKPEAKNSEAAQPEQKQPEAKKPEAVKPAAKPEVKPEAKKTEAKAQAEKPAPFKPDAVLIALSIPENAKGTEVKLSGKVVRVDKSTSRATDYALAGDNAILGFLYAPGKAAELKALANKEVNVTGTAFAVKDWNYKVIAVRSVEKSR